MTGPTKSEIPESAAPTTDETVDITHSTRSAMVDPAIAAVRRRRSELKAAMSALESAMAGPAERDPEEWLRMVRDRISALAEAFRHHVSIHEGTDSFHAEILRSRPHLAPRVARLQRDHRRLGAALAGLVDVVDNARGSEAVVEARALGTDVLMQLVRHRQRGADMVWDAFNRDLGGED